METMVTACPKRSTYGTKRRCTGCQERHLKCEHDGRDDKCKPCRTHHRTCVVAHRFQPVDPAPSSGSAAKKARTKADKSRSGEKPVIQDDQQGETSGVVDEHPDSLGDHVGPDRGTVRLSKWTGRSSQTFSPIASPPDPAFVATRPDVLSPAPPVGVSPASPVSSRLTATSVESIPSPVKEKAVLFRHFTEVLSRWFDVCDPLQHFRRAVPTRALRCPTLTKAICASAAWHLCRLGQFNQDRSNLLYQNCLDHMIRAMDDPEVKWDDSLLVAAVIMHHLEELRESSMRLESRGHVVAIHIFVDHETMDGQSSLRQAALRVAMREEIHMAFMLQQPLTLPVDMCRVDRGLGETDDDTWAWRMIMHYRDALAYSIAPTSAEIWDDLLGYQEAWHHAKPESFTPIFHEEVRTREGRYLPEVWFLQDSHIIGMIHYHLCRIVLAISDPRVPRIGWNKTTALARVDEEVKNNVIDVCGIAASNSVFPSAMLAAIMVITMCAERFTDPNVQFALQQILIRTREIHAYPTEAAQSYVRSLWHG